jgi:hypothetical protein
MQRLSAHAATSFNGTAQESRFVTTDYRFVVSRMYHLFKNRHSLRRHGSMDGSDSLTYLLSVLVDGFERLRRDEVATVCVALNVENRY